jgi:hypothetical protein
VIQPDHIFCEPEFAQEVGRLISDSSLHIFSSDVKTVLSDVSNLNISEGQLVWLLYAPAEPLGENSRVKDHINLCRENPLIGPELAGGPRFPDMSAIYLDDEGIIAVLGEDEDLAGFQESWISVCGGVWEAIVLSQQGVKCRAWVITDLEKWLNELPAFD